ncbi:MAG: LpqB family beta-propeller domain-containing protein [Candidatus Nanopelagicales bacterium]
MTGSGARPWPRFAAQLLALGLLLTGCASVPTSGPIRQGPVVDAGEGSQFIRVIAAPPSLGASPQEIVRGFLEASASLESDHAIARRYLTPAASAAWAPAESTTVYQRASLVLAAPAEDVIEASIRITGRLLADGSLEPVDPAEPAEVPFALEQVSDGASGVLQWRIADLPPGLLINDTDLRRAYRQYQTYFPSARSSALVPDARLLPVAGPSLPTTLAERLLAGPAQWLAPGVRTGVPQGTALALGAVPVTDGVAVVELTDQVLSATGDQRRDLAAQLTWTLTQLPEVSAVRVLVRGEILDVPGAPTLMDQADWSARSPDVVATGPRGLDQLPYYVLDGASVSRVSQTGRTSIPVDVPDPEGLTGLAVALDQRVAAAVTPDARGLWLLALDRDLSERRIEGQQLGGASFDVDGSLWFVDAGILRRLGSDGEPVTVAVSGAQLAGPVTSVHLARDGARVVLVAGGRAYLGVLATDGDTVISVESVRRLGSAVTEVTDVAWRDATSLDVLGSAQASSPQVLRMSVGTGTDQALGAPLEPIEVAAAPGSPSLVSTGESLFVNVGLQWRPQGDGRSVAYPG